MFDLLNTLATLTIAVLLLYWQFREMLLKVNYGRSRHGKFAQTIIRLLLPATALMLVAQLLGFFTFPLPLVDTNAERLTIVGHILFWLVVPLSVWARETMGNFWVHAADLQVLPGQSLIRRGPFRYIRHPIYAFFFLLFISVEFIVASWLIVLVVPLALFFYWQAKKEEELLLEVFGEKYRSYQRSTNMFFPFV